MNRNQKVPVHGARRWRGSICPRKILTIGAHYFYRPVSIYPLLNVRRTSLRSVIPTSGLWKELLEQPWLHNGESDPLDERTGQSVLSVWIHNPEPRVYICQVPLEDSGTYCGTKYQRQDRALTHVRTHLNYKPFICRGRCGMKDW